jgi:hypothetical protein
MDESLKNKKGKKNQAAICSQKNCKDEIGKETRALRCQSRAPKQQTERKRRRFGLAVFADKSPNLIGTSPGCMTSR